MALTSITSFVEYTGTGSVKAFTIPFGFALGAHIKAVLISPGGVETPQVIGTHYTVTPDGGAAGTATFLVAPASGWKVRLFRVTPRTQLVQLVTQGPFNPGVLERMMDLATMQIQELNDGITVNSQHGDQPGGTLHTLATRTTAGFLGGTDKAKYDDHVDVTGNPHGTTWEDTGAAPADHTHTEYADKDHDHDDRYAGTGHHHDDRYGSRAEADDIQGRVATIETQVPPLVAFRDNVSPKIIGYDAHLATTAGNPHGTTAGMIGAALAGHIHSQADVGALVADLNAIRARLLVLETKPSPPLPVYGEVETKAGGPASISKGVGIDSVTRTGAGVVDVKIKNTHAMASKNYMVVATPIDGAGTMLSCEVKIVDAENFTVMVKDKDGGRDIGFRFLAWDPK